MSLEELDSPKVVLIYGRPGHGKTTLIKHYIRSLSYHHLYIVSASLHDDYNDESLIELELDPNDVQKNFEFNEDEIKEFRAKDGIKLLIMDDILHLDISGSYQKAIRDIVSTSRHYNLYIIIGVQLLKTMGKALRFCAHVFLTGSIDEDSVQVLAALSGNRPNTFKNIHIPKYEFIGSSTSGKIFKVLSEESTQRPQNEQLLEDNDEKIENSFEKEPKTNDS
jgi:predicted ATP-dependent serine protease